MVGDKSQEAKVGGSWWSRAVSVLYIGVSQREGSDRKGLTRVAASPNRSQTSQKCFAKVSSLTGAPLILILSLTATRCGEVYSPTLASGASVLSKEEQKAEVDPLPFVPVMWITLSGLRSEGCVRGHQYRVRRVL